jgi:hypothetical protein
LVFSRDFCKFRAKGEDVKDLEEIVESSPVLGYLCVEDADAFTNES